MLRGIIICIGRTPKVVKSLGSFQTYLTSGKVSQGVKQSKVDLSTSGSCLNYERSTTADSRQNEPLTHGLCYPHFSFVLILALPFLDTKKGNCSFLLAMALWMVLEKF